MEHMPWMWLATVHAARSVAVVAVTISLVAAIGALVAEVQRRSLKAMRRVRSRLIRDPSPLVEAWLDWSQRRDFPRKLRDSFILALSLSVFVTLVSIVIYHT
jgi:hypothetical protein